MIYYKKETKELVIPSGFVLYSSDCEEAIEQAYQNGYNDGLAACSGSPEINDAIVVQNDVLYGWSPTTGRDLLLDGVPYSATGYGTFYGTMCQFNVGPDNIPSTTPSSITFTIDCNRSTWESVVGGIDVSMLAIFGANVENFTQTKVVTTPQLDPNSYIGVTYTLTIDNQ